MDVSFPQTESYLAESPARLEETAQSLYADEQPRKSYRKNMETHSKLAETVGIENTIMLNPEDLAKVSAREETFNRDFNKNFGVNVTQSFAGQRRRGVRRPYEDNDITPSTSLPETRTSVIRGTLSNRNIGENEQDSDTDAPEYNSLRCFEQVEKESGDLSRNRHYVQGGDNRMDAYTSKADAAHVSEKFSRSPCSSNLPFQMSSMETRPSYNFAQRDSGYGVQYPPDFVLSQMDSRGKQYYERQMPDSASFQKGYNPKFFQNALFMQSHPDFQGGYPGWAKYNARLSINESLPKDSHLPVEREASEANAKSNPSPIGKIHEEESLTRQASHEREIVKSSERADLKQLDDNKNIKGKRGAGRKVEGTIQCSQCSKGFSSSSALAKHKATHSDERKYICTICEKGFKRQDHLTGHMMTHRDKKPHECKYCPKSYCDQRSLKRHYEHYHPNPEQLQPVSSTSSITETDLLRMAKQEGRFTPDSEGSRPSPLGMQSKQEVPLGGYGRKRNSDSMCSNSSDDLNKRPNSHSPHVSFDKPQSAVSMLKQVMDSHELKKDKYPRQSYYSYPESFNPQQWFTPYPAQMMKLIPFNKPPILVPHGHPLGQISNRHCSTDPPQLVPNYPPMTHTSQGTEDTTDDSGRSRGDDKKDFVVPTDPTSIAIVNAKEQGERKVQFKDGNTAAFPHVVQWKTVPVGKEKNGMPPHSMGNNVAAMQLPASMIVPDQKVKRERPAELNIYIPSSQGEKRQHEMVTTTEQQAKRHCPPPPSPASLNMAKEGLLKLADVSIKSENNCGNVFKNPPTTPPRKTRPRPDPINISCSNLQFGSSLSPPIYTPPPMLSPHSIFHTPRCVNTPVTPGRFFLSGNRSRKNSIESEAGPEAPTEIIMPEPKINIGPGFQAEVVSTVEPRSEAMYDKHRAAICWMPFEHETRQRAQDIEAFLDMACSVAVFGGGSNKEYALHVLYRLKGNIKLAVKHILANKSAIHKGDGLADYHYEGSERWSSKERLRFREALENNGKSFYEISKEIKTKTTQQCVEFYYLWKACRPEGMRSRRGYAEETGSEPENEAEFSDDSETTYIFECDFPECNSKFISRQALNGHIRVHGGSFMKPSEPKRTKVPKSTASSDSSSSSLSVPTNVNRVPVKPPRPTKPATTGTQPIVLNSDGTMPEFPCKVCGRVFHKIKSRSAHMKTHVKRNDDDHVKSKS